MTLLMSQASHVVISNSLAFLFLIDSKVLWPILSQVLGKHLCLFCQKPNISQSLTIQANRQSSIGSRDWPRNRETIEPIIWPRERLTIEPWGAIGQLPRTRFQSQEHKVILMGPGTHYSKTNRFQGTHAIEPLIMFPIHSSTCKHGIKGSF